MLREQKVVYTLFIFIGLLGTMQAEYLIVQPDPDDPAAFLPITQYDAYADHVLQIMQTYQWPMCLAYLDTISPEEQKLLFSDKPCAEEVFLRQKIKNIYPSYDIIFIPQTLYDLVALFVIQENEFDFIKEKDCIFDSNKLIPPLLRNQAVKPHNVYDVYDHHNQAIMERHYFVMHACIYNYLSSWVFVHTLSDYFLGKPLESNQDNVDVMDIEQDLKETLENMIAAMMPSLRELLDELRGFKQKNIQTLFDEKLNILQKTLRRIMHIESSAHEKNNTLLYRGISLFDAPYAYDNTGRRSSIRVIDYPVSVSSDYAYDKQHSISYGNSFLAGIYNDLDATPFYYYLKGGNAYTMHIPKQSYVNDEAKDLFFIAPLCSLAGLCGMGEFFHSRSRVCVKAQGVPQLVDGVHMLGGVVDYSNVIAFEGDCYAHARNLMHFISPQNVVVLPALDTFVISDLDDAYTCFPAQEIHFALNNMERAAAFLQTQELFNAFKINPLSYFSGMERVYCAVLKEFFGHNTYYPPYRLIPDRQLASIFLQTLKTIKKTDQKSREYVTIDSGDTIIVIDNVQKSVHGLLRQLKRLKILGYLHDNLRLAASTHLVVMAHPEHAYGYSSECLYTLLQLFVRNPQRVTWLQSPDSVDVSHDHYNLIDDLYTRYGKIGKILGNVFVKKISPLLPQYIVFHCNKASLFCGCKNTIEKDIADGIDFKIYSGQASALGSGWFVIAGGDQRFSMREIVDQKNVTLQYDQDFAYMTMAETPSWNRDRGDDCLAVFYSEQSPDQKLLDAYAYTSSLFRSLKKAHHFLSNVFQPRCKEHTAAMRRIHKLVEQGLEDFPHESINVLYELFLHIDGYEFNEVLFTTLIRLLTLHGTNHVFEKRLSDLIFVAMKNFFYGYKKNKAFFVHVIDVVFDFQRYSEAFLVTMLKALLNDTSCTHTFIQFLFEKITTQAQAHFDKVITVLSEVAQVFKHRPSIASLLIEKKDTLYNKRFQK